MRLIVIVAIATSFVCVPLRVRRRRRGTRQLTARAARRSGALATSAAPGIT